MGRGIERVLQRALLQATLNRGLAQLAPLQLFDISGINGAQRLFSCMRQEQGAQAADFDQSLSGYFRLGLGTRWRSCAPAGVLPKVPELPFAAGGGVRSISVDALKPSDRRELCCCY